MKSKILISLLLALLMVGTLAAPALADPPAGAGKLNPEGDESGKGVYVLQTTPDDELRIIVVLNGAEPNQTYTILLWWQLWKPIPPRPSHHPGDITTDEKGNGRFVYISEDGGWGSGTTKTFQLNLGPWETPNYIGDPVTVTFKP